MKFQIEVIKSKIHRVSVTQANLNYVGSITIDEALMEAANMIEGEKVQIMDINNGERFETYIIKGERDSGCICLNGAAARKVAVGDVVSMASTEGTLLVSGIRSRPLPSGIPGAGHPVPDVPPPPVTPGPPPVPGSSPSAAAPTLPPGHGPETAPHGTRRSGELRSHAAFPAPARPE